MASLRVDSRREKTNRTVSDFDGVETEREQLLEPRVPVLSLAQLRIGLGPALHEIDLGTEERSFRNDRAAQQAAPLHRQIDSIRTEERHRPRRASLYDLDAVDAVRATPEMDVDVARRARRTNRAPRAVVDEVLDQVRQRDARRDQQQHHGQQCDDYLASAGHEGTNKRGRASGPRVNQVRAVKRL